MTSFIRQLRLLLLGMWLGAAIFFGAAVVHLVCVIFFDGLPRWMGWPLLAAYVWFVSAGLMG